MISSLRRSRLSLFSAVLAAAAIAPACSLLASTDGVQCTTDADCASRGFSGATCEASVCVTASTSDAGDAGSDADTKWGCVGSVTWGVQDPSETVLYRGRFLTALTELPIADLEVKACGRLDADCTTPFATAKTDAEGYANLLVPKYFNGFYEFNPPVDSGIMPSISLALPPPETSAQADASIPAAISVHLITATAFNSLLNQIGATPDPQLGHIFGLILDCTGVPAARVSLHASPITPSTIAYYTTASGVPSVTAQETAQAGEAGFVNLPPGSAQLTATANDASKKVGEYATTVRAGTITYLPMPPSP